MAEKDQSGFSFDPKTAFLIVALLGGGAYFFSKPLQSSRPSVNQTIGRTALGDQVIPARLWQDPFGVAMAYRKKRRQEAGALEPAAREGSRTNLARDSIAETAQQIVRHANQTGKQPTITILEVMLSGGSYAEDTETRLRGRYAVLSALGVAGFVPWDAEHIGFAEINWPRGRDLEGRSQLSIPALPIAKSPDNSHLILPYEWFVPNQEKPPANSNDVLILWLNADAFADHPLKRLAQLNHLLGAEVTNAVRSDLKNPFLKFKLINPSLYSILREDFNSKGQTNSDSTIQLTNILSNLTIFSSWATTADALLVPDADGIRGAGVTNSIWAHGPSLVNVTCTDDQLIEELIDELALRGVHPENGRDAVALLSEWDTFYGRALPITFAAVVKSRMNDSFTPDSFLNLREVVGWLTSPGKPNAYLLSQLSRNTVRLLTNADPNQAKMALAADLNRFLETELKPELVAEQFGSFPSAAFPTNHPGPVPKGKQRHLNRLLLEHAFGDAIAKNQLSAAVEELRTNPAAWPTNILHYTYLRGVDGKTPGDADAEPKADTANTEKTDDAHTKPETPRAEGHSQMDYMPRQASRLADLEFELERKSNLRFEAVGILGSDVYDKLLVLQALRPMFHDELFFTTDLDARLLHPAELDWTRNLIVASSFGLQLSPDIQSDVPPFRDTYQTGTYLACLVAMDFPAAVANLGSLLPRRYEIGRAGALDISICDSRIQRPLPDSKLLVFLKDWHNVFWLLLAGVSLIVLAGLLSRSGLAGLARVRSLLWRGPNETKPPAPFAELPWWGFRLALLAPAGLVGVFLALMVLDQCNRQGEPFVLSLGTSIWPTEVLRMVAACLSFFFLFKARADLRDNKNKLTSRYSLPKLGKLRLRTVWKHRRSIWIFCWRPATRNGSHLYRQYNHLGHAWCRWYRTLWASLSYILLGVGILFLFDLPFRPYRGTLSSGVDLATTVLASLLLVLLLFFVVDASFLCRRFIELLHDTAIEWPGPVCKRLAADSGANCDDLHEYISVRVIATRSEAVGKLIYYPFLIIFLAIVARNSFWDHWDWPPSMSLILGLDAAYAVYAVLSLRNAAEKARKVFLRGLNAKLLRAIGSQQEERADQIRELIQEVEACEEGAFAPITQQPVVRALMMPFGGAGLVTLVNYLVGRV